MKKHNVIFAAPAAVQFNRIILLLYSILAIAGFWNSFNDARSAVVMVGVLIVSVYGLIVSCIRTKAARWIFAGICFFLPASFAAGVIVANNRTSAAIEGVMLFVLLPLVFVSSLFLRQKEAEYFQGPTA
jgi:hypothetical protein